MDFIPADNISRQCIKIAKYITMTFAYHSTSYLFNRLKNSETLLAGLSITLDGCATLNENVLTDRKLNYLKNKTADESLNKKTSSATFLNQNATVSINGAPPSFSYSMSRKWKDFSAD